ncbi:MAG: AAA family ATPase [Thiomargarita sp.]|nr:AAA family ATPase [Thiomargarita sp.]
MKVISIFNNKGGVGKTTLAYHLSHILAEMGKRILILDLDPQCNISLYGMQEEQLEKIWVDEDKIIDNGFYDVDMKGDNFKNLLKTTRTIHFLLKPVEEGISDFEILPPPFKITENLDLIPSRLTLSKYENKISERWSGMFLGESLSIRTVTRIRKIAELYTEQNNYDFVIVDTSPNLGALNKVIISTVDGFIIPCLPDMFSLYGIKNIGKVLTQWNRDFSTCRSILSEEKRAQFPQKTVAFLGYTIYNAKKRSDKSEYWNLPIAHFHYAEKIPDAIKTYIDERVRTHLSEEMVEVPIGDNAVMHTHNTFPNMAQKYKQPMWKVPKEEKNIGNSKLYKETRIKYEKFALDFLKRVKTLDD